MGPRGPLPSDPQQELLPLLPLPGLQQAVWGEEHVTGTQAFSIKGPEGNYRATRQSKQPLENGRTASMGASGP